VAGEHEENGDQRQTHETEKNCPTMALEKSRRLAPGRD